MLRGLDQFLVDFPGMTVIPGAGQAVEIAGEFTFTASAEGRETITDSYELTIKVPNAFPRALPSVTETAKKIPRVPDFHVNGDGTLCVGAPIRLLLILSHNPTVDGYATKCLVPYLYAISHKLKFGGAFIFDELAHGEKGALADYAELFGLRTPGQVKQALSLLTIPERAANKQACPCGCGRRFGQCSFRTRLRKFRHLAKRSWFASHYS